MCRKRVKMKKPIVGITLDSRGIGGYSERYPWYALRKNYTDIICQAGGIPVALPHHREQVKNYTHMLDGLLVTGGAVDVAPELYGELSVHPTVITNLERTTFEIDVVKNISALSKPCLGICGGMQVLNVARGGSLYQDIPTQLPEALNHVQKTDRHEASHWVSVLADSQMFDVCGKNNRIQVNSVHHQCVKNVGHGLIVNAIADDGVIEGIEDPHLPFFMGVQWHPEFHVTEHDHALIERFIAKCQNL